ncbi:Abi family protein [Geomonas sp. RF6]|uniref:Abi family protein n=1 Tax=Geomonas sp. RF6 TaxID=2897342 RepID=UPI001E6578D9|nr:Abi family protein [Geomonas sp. RF6]UFS72057.1 Abi family protein [Geomonas sp. RF6]
MMLKPGGLFFRGMVHVRYEKASLSVAEQAALIMGRGLACDDVPRLEKYLSTIGYYRLSAYWLPFEYPPESPHTRSHRLIPGTTFEQVLALYVFDRKLRMMVMEAMERIEVAIRTRWANALAVRHGSHAYMQSDLFKNPWQHSSDLGKIAANLEESKEPFVAHYRRQYKQPFLPPIWAVVETMTLGALSRWFKNTNDTAAKKEVAQAFSMPTIEILEQVLHALTPVRNICAHHSRLWNRRFAMSLPKIKRIEDRLVAPEAPNGQAHYLFNFLVVLDLLMTATSPGSSWTRRLLALVDTLDHGPAAMGFPSDWRERNPWKYCLTHMVIAPTGAQ